jgi:hypothetical protein
MSERLWFRFWLALLLLPQIGWGQEQFCFHVDKRGATRPLEINQKTLVATLYPDTLTQRVSGTVEIQFSVLRSGLSSIFLDGPNMIFQNVFLDGRAVAFSVSDSGLHIPVAGLVPEKDHVLKIAYDTKPQKGLYFVGWNGPANARRQIWSQGQGIDHRHWIPHVDAQNDKLQTSLNVVFDSDYQVISNGHLKQKVEQEGGTTLWQFEFTGPHPSYLMMLAIGQFEKQVLPSTEHSRVEIINYYYADRKETVPFTYRYTREILDFLEAEIGVPYPWGNLYVQVPVKDFLYGGMENTGATIFLDFYHSDEVAATDLGYFRVNAHELAHQWFGNLITSYGGRDHWLHEGFATYFEYLCTEALFGKRASDEQRLKALDAVLEAPFEKPIAHADAGSLSHYQKAALVLHMLRTRLGPDDYRRAVSGYVQQFKYGLVNSNDFEMSLHRSTGLNFQKFLFDWVHQPDVPELHVRFATEIVGKGRKKQQGVVMVASQFAPSDNLFELPIHVRVMQGTNTFDTLIWLREAEATFEWTLPFVKGPVWAYADPNRDLLVDLRQQWQLKDFEGLWEHAHTYGQKWQLVRDLARFDADTTLPLVIRSLQQVEDSDTLKAMLYGVLFDHYSSRFPEGWNYPEWVMADLEGTRSPEIALTWLQSNGRKPESDFLPFLFDLMEIPKTEVWEQVLFALLMHTESGLQHGLAVTAMRADQAYGTFPVSWHFLSMVTGNSEELPNFLSYLGPAADGDQRRYAFEILTASRWISASVIRDAVEASGYFNRRVSGAARTYLKKLYEFPQAKEMIDKWMEEEIESASEREALYQKIGLKLLADAN